MTLSRPVSLDTTTARSTAPPPISRSVSNASPRRWDSRQLHALLEGGGGVLGTQRTDQRFDDDHLGVVSAGDVLELPALIVVAGNADVELTNRSTSIKTLEWERIHEMLAETGFNISETARRLGMHRRTLARKLEKQRIK